MNRHNNRNRKLLAYPRFRLEHRESGVCLVLHSDFAQTSRRFELHRSPLRPHARNPAGPNLGQAVEAYKKVGDGKGEARVAGLCGVCCGPVPLQPQSLQLLLPPLPLLPASPAAAAAATLLASCFSSRTCSSLQLGRCKIKLGWDRMPAWLLASHPLPSP